ncbi:hypothetical protein [uncultured Campylobacter sp.]|uniref:hypothetical protein n=1 Tax=uncultured Campylobacter sp. TaxID=218934 RepID=UPI002631CD35|nr:hypothetical protein [uncultured Campylobacter sp.]
MGGGAARKFSINSHCIDCIKSPPFVNLTAKRAYLGAADGEISSRKFNRRAAKFRDCG